MIYQENISFDGKQWYLFEWEGIEFRKMDLLFKSKECNSLEKLSALVLKEFPDCKATFTLIEPPRIAEEPKKKKKK